MTLEIRPITPEEFPAFIRATEAAFGHVPGDQEIELWRMLFEIDRTLAVFDEGRIVGTAAAFSFELTVPGQRQISAAGVTGVGVLPTHRRQGILRDLMRRQLDDVRQRGEPVAILGCSESSIYGRFGYGPATSMLSVEIDRRHGAFARPFELAGRLSLIDYEQAITVLPDLYDRVRRLRPGALKRHPKHWQVYLQLPGPSPDGGGTRFYVRHQNSSGAVDGIAYYRIRREWQDGISAATLTLRELIALTPEVHAALWHFCLNVDLVQTIQAVARPLDEPLRWLLADPRRLRVTSLTDDLWVRLLDIPAALAARRYGTSDRLVIEVADTFCPENTGRYELEGGPDGAVCRPTTAAPDLALDVADLGAAYLGGVQFSTLAWAGRVRALTPRALERADALFGSDVVPWCATPF